ncbi:CPG_1a_G0016470.mRNA.1.CDS.1 [Saccharomyces cerevisiae]|nr:CPG_1a_G0016470.mRNA.1.CDS.1 [Saccharomyces cerevisiae]CAI7271633.1 CPG_1a_G0016470.mRNA.1.CDS.1 [Saccharomyces cerevisiae]
MATKQLLRRQIKRVINALDYDIIAAESHTISQAVRSLIASTNSRHVACYMSMDKGEVTTGEIIKNLFQDGQEVFLPRCTHTSESKHFKLREDHHPHLIFHRMSSLKMVRDLKPQGPYQLKEPEPHIEESDILDVVLVPGVAFDIKTGARMGHGAGYYDDFFQRYKILHEGQKPLLVGLCLMEQVASPIPLEKHDYSMDCIVCGDGSIHWFQ